MAKFVAIYSAPVGAFDEMMKNSTPEQQKAGMESWQKWMQVHKGSFVDEGAPLSKNKHITKEGVADTRNEVSGFSVVEADSLDDAAKLFSDCPHIDAVPGAYIDVLTWVQM